MRILLTKIKVMKKEYPGGVYRPVLVSGRQLLEEVHITKLNVIVLIQEIVEPGKKTVLIEIVIHDSFTEIDVNLIIDHPRYCTFFILLCSHRNLH
jgi:hypothetical protein